MRSAAEPRATPPRRRRRSERRFDQQTLSNSGQISGGAGSATFSGTFEGGGAGLSNKNTITTLINNGTIGGGAGGKSIGGPSNSEPGAAGGAGIVNSQGAMLGSRD